MGIEIELKLAAPDNDTLDRIAALDEIAGYDMRKKDLVHIRDTAFDTPDNCLYHGRVVFRLREKNSRRFLTFKAYASREGSVFRREEEESPTDAIAGDISAGRLPDIPPAQRFRERFGDVPLSPCLTTDNDRRAFHLVRDGIPRYELALDDVTFSGPRGTARVREVEIEALTEDHRDLCDIGVWLGERFPLAPAGPSKFILGMDLVGTVQSSE